MEMEIYIYIYIIERERDSTFGKRLKEFEAASQWPDGHKGHAISINLVDQNEKTTSRTMCLVVVVQWK